MARLKPRCGSLALSVMWYVRTVSQVWALWLDLRVKSLIRQYPQQKLQGARRVYTNIRALVKPYYADRILSDVGARFRAGPLKVALYRYFRLVRSNFVL